MRIGLVGYGAWGRLHASAIARLDGLALAGVVCGGAASAQQAASDTRALLSAESVARRLNALLDLPLSLGD